MTRADEMREFFARWKDSGQSLKAFGKAEGVGYQKLMYWRGRLGDDARREPTKKTSAAALEFAPVHIVPDKPSAESRSPKFQVNLANGVSLGVEHGFDEHELRRLLGVLRTC